MDFGNMTRRFLMGEWNTQASSTSRIASIGEALKSLKPRTLQEKQRIELALENLTHIRREHRKLKEQVLVLEERLLILEEGKGED